VKNTSMLFGKINYVIFLYPPKNILMAAERWRRRPFDASPTHRPFRKRLKICRSIYNLVSFLITGNFPLPWEGPPRGTTGLHRFYWKQQYEGIGHYVAYTLRSDGHWETFNDLNQKREAGAPKIDIKCHIIL
jgi:hypothetical protein